MEVEIEPRAQPERLDRALTDALARAGHPHSRTALRRAFEQGHVRSEGRVLKASMLVREPLRVSVVLPAPEPLKAEPEDIPLQVVFEDDHLLVVDKPAPMVVHAGPGHRHGTLVGAVLHHLAVDAEALPVMPGNDALRPGIVHRLDRGTSGLLVVAKTRVAQVALAEQFARHTIERAYLGIVWGHPKLFEQRVETLHGRDPRDRRRFSPHVPQGRRAVTECRLVKTVGPGALMRFTLETGRTHQIRMHARMLGTPIVGDSLYGKPAPDPALRAELERLDRHALHATVLGFLHPVTGQALRWESPLPPALQDVLLRLEVL